MLFDLRNDMPSDKSLPPLIIGLLLLTLLSGCTFRTAGPESSTVQFGVIRQEAGDDSRAIMTEAELQSQVMSYADRFASYILQSYEDFDVLAPPLEQRRVILRNAVFSVSSAYTIAAETDPDVALLDMVVMVTLGHLVYKEHWLPELGESIEPMVQGFLQAREDVWQIAARLLDADQQQELLTMIEEWRQEHPAKLAFSYVRFGDFAADRRRSTIGRSGDPEGLLRSVKRATRQVDEIRLLAERKMFLATRLPLLTGFFLDMSISQAFVNPQINVLLDDLHIASQSTERLALSMEELPIAFNRERQEFIEQTFSRLTAERQAAINHAMDRFAVERQKTLEDFLAEEERLKGLLTELRETLTAGSGLVVATNDLVEKLNLGQGPSFDINEYKKAIEETTMAIAQLNQLVGEANLMLNSSGWENLFPKFEKTIDRVGEESNEIIDHTFLRGIFLLLIWFVGYIVAKLTLQRISSSRSRNV